MRGRTIFVILFSWAALTVITPILIRLSASASLEDHNEIKNGGIQSGKEVGLLARRALGSIELPKKEIFASPSPSPSPLSSPSLKLHRQPAFEPEVSGDTGIAFIPKKLNIIT